MSESSSLERRILMVEDNPTFAAFLSKALEQGGYTHTQVIADGLEGLNAVLRQPPDLLILDLDLPTLDGIEICRVLRSNARTRRLPILISSELPDAKRLELELLRLGADDYLKKPFSATELLRRVGKQLETPVPGNEPETLSAGSLNIDRHLRRIIEDDADTPALERPVPADRNFQGYELLDLLGGGGMGTVYMARQISLNRLVALKVLLDHLQGNVDSRHRFRREAMIMAQVCHPNIVTIFDFGSSAFTNYITMELIDGVSLDGAIRADLLTPEQGVDVMRQACAGLDYLHRRGIVHGDIKPSNILLAKEGFVKIVDFGISRARLPQDTAESQRQHDAMGTFAYMAPELFDNQPASPQSDIFALGVTFWRLFAGFEEKSAHLPLRDLRPDLPAELSDVLRRAMDTEAGRRFQNVADFREALLQACGMPPSTLWNRASASA